jgi:DNA-binding NtrC family response regulator
MSRLPGLICYGHDDLLLFTRKKILEREFSVETCTQVPELDAALSRGPVEVIVICHSVPDEECHEVVLRVREQSPSAKVLVLYEAVPEVCTEDSDKTMECLEGPSTLLRDVRALMEEAAEESAGRR